MGCVPDKIQLASLAERNMEVFKKHYSNELKCILDFSEKAGTDEESIEQKGLRLALLSFACEDAASLRNSLSKQLILELLNKRDGLTTNEISKLLSDELKLPKAIDNNYIARILKLPDFNDLISESNGKWIITHKGKADVSSIPAEAFDHFLAGRNILFNGIYELTGHKLEPDTFNKVWNIFQDYIAHLFYSNGLDTVKMISALLNDEAVTNDHYKYNELIEELAGKISSLFSDPEQSEAIKHAIPDIFSERSGDAFQWLASICSVFVSLCSLGLEGTSAEQITKTLRKTKLVIDTDILISLLCDREPQHDAVRELFKKWKGIGGEIYIHSSVLKEAAYHAWISEADYNEVSRNFKDIKTEEETDRYIVNAFVRTFKLISNKNYSYRAWHSYISDFRGDSEYDYSKILEICTDDYGVLILKDVDLEKYKDFVDDVNKFIYNLKLKHRKNDGVSSEEMKRLTGKSENDAHLLGSILQFRDIERAKGSQETISLISSSVLFQAADSYFSNSLKKPEAVLTLSAVSYMISLLPGVKYNINSLRNILFSFGRRINLRPEERIALRILKGTEEYDFPFSKRATLSRNLRDALRKEAKNNDTSINAEYEQFIKWPTSEGQAGKNARIIVEAVEKISSFEKQSDKKFYEAIQENVKLKKENEGLREILREQKKKK